ncbi:MAG: hypothetical protein ACYDCL_00750 [Myxococcales bacterium]
MAASLAPLLALSLAATPPTLWLTLPTTGTGPCTEAEVVSSIHAREPGVDVRTGGSARPGDASAALAVEGGTWSLTVQSAGLRPLRRELPTPGADCVATSDTAALMLDRYLDDIHWSGRGTAFADLERPRVEGVVEVGSSLAASPVGALPALELDLGARRGPFQLGLGGSVAWPEQSAFPAPYAGAYSVQLASARLVAAWRPRLGPGTARVELAPGAELFWVGASYPSATRLFQNHPAFDAAPYLGLRLGYELALPARFAVALRAEGRLLLIRPSFEVQGEQASIPPVAAGPLDGNVTVALSRSFF